MDSINFFLIILLPSIASVLVVEIMYWYSDIFDLLS